MAAKKQKKLRYKYRISIFNEDTFEEVWRSRLSRINVIILMFFFAVLVATITVVLVFFTPVKEYIPGYPDADISNTIFENYLLTDSLQKKVEEHEAFYTTIHSIMSGNIPENWHAEKEQADTLNTTELMYLDEINLDPSVADSAFRQQIEDEERYNLSMLDQINKADEKDDLLLVVPMKGVVTTKFNPAEGHFGVDFVGAENERITAVASGTVIMADWTMDAGYVIQIQHDKNLVSIYKHNSDLMLKTGDKVKAGQVIAIIGNTGELSYGTHLHLELWENGVPIDPLNHIIF